MRTLQCWRVPRSSASLVSLARCSFRIDALYNTATPFGAHPQHQLGGSIVASCSAWSGYSKLQGCTQFSCCGPLHLQPMEPSNVSVPPREQVGQPASLGPAEVRLCCLHY